MNTIIKIYGFLLGLYPTAFRDEFQEQMLLDFSDMAADAVKKGLLSLALFCFRELFDFPISLLHIHSKENRMFDKFNSTPWGRVLRIAFAFGMALAINNFAGVLSFLDQERFITVLKFMHSANWQGTYKDLEPLRMFLPSLTVGPLLAGLFLLMAFPEMRPVKRYLPMAMLVFIIPAVMSMLAVYSNFTFSATIFGIANLMLPGLGFGILASFALGKRAQLPWFLLIGLVGYFFVNWISALLILGLHRQDNYIFWVGAVSVALRNFLEGAGLGVLFGLFIEFQNKSAGPQVFEGN